MFAHPIPSLLNEANQLMTPVVSEPIRPCFSRLSNIKEILSKNKELLKQCGWYYGHLSWAESSDLLSHTTEGTFLVRDSADSRFLYSLSIQRKPEEGPTSVRLHFTTDGKFRLDSDERIDRLMPQFDSVLDLVQYYCQLNNSDLKFVLSDSNNKKLRHSSISLRTPLLKKIPSLTHITRLVIWKNLKYQQELSNLKLPKKLRNYLLEYHFFV